MANAYSVFEAVMQNYSSSTVDKIFNKLASEIEGGMDTINNAFHIDNDIKDRLINEFKGIMKGFENQVARYQVDLFKGLFNANGSSEEIDKVFSVFESKIKSLNSLATNTKIKDMLPDLDLNSFHKLIEMQEKVIENQEKIASLKGKRNITKQRESAKDALKTSEKDLSSMIDSLIQSTKNASGSGGSGSGVASVINDADLNILKKYNLSLNDLVKKMNKIKNNYDNASTSDFKNFIGYYQKYAEFVSNTPGLKLDADFKSIYENLLKTEPGIKRFADRLDEIKTKMVTQTESGVSADEFSRQNEELENAKTSLNNLKQELDRINQKYKEQTSLIDKMQKKIKEVETKNDKKVVGSDKYKKVLADLENAKEKANQFQIELEKSQVNVKSLKTVLDGLKNNETSQKNDSGVISDIEKNSYISTSAVVQNEKKKQEAYKATTETVMYHAGVISKLNKAETNGRFYGSNRGTGYFGTGHYFVDSATKHELDDNSAYSKLPYTSIDISQYDNLFKAATNEIASGLHEFLKNLTRFTQGSDRYDTSELFSQFQKVFGDTVMDMKEFDSKLGQLKSFMQSSNISDRSDSVSTQFMKYLGYAGVDTRGTKYADTRYGTVIYDLKEESVLQSNITDELQKQGQMLEKINYEKGQVFDKTEDVRIQGILDQQQKEKEVRSEFNKLYDSSKIKQYEAELETVNDKLQKNSETITDLEYHLDNVDKLAKKFANEMSDFGMEVSDDEIKEQEDRYRTSFLEGIDKLQKEQILLESRKKQLKENINAESETVNSAWEQARQIVEKRQLKSKQTENIVPNEMFKKSDFDKMSSVIENLKSEVSSLTENFNKLKEENIRLSTDLQLTKNENTSLSGQLSQQKELSNEQKVQIENAQKLNSELEETKNKYNELLETTKKAKSKQKEVENSFKIFGAFNDASKIVQYNEGINTPDNFVNFDYLEKTKKKLLETGNAQEKLIKAAVYYNKYLENGGTEHIFDAKGVDITDQLIQKYKELSALADKNGQISEEGLAKSLRTINQYLLKSKEEEKTLKAQISLLEKKIELQGKANKVQEEEKPKVDNSKKKMSKEDFIRQMSDAHKKTEKKSQPSQPAKPPQQTQSPASTPVASESSTPTQSNQNIDSEIAKLEELKKAVDKVTFSLIEKTKAIQAEDVQMDVSINSEIAKLEELSNKIDEVKNKFLNSNHLSPSNSTETASNGKEELEQESLLYNKIIESLSKYLSLQEKIKAGNQKIINEDLSYINSNDIRKQTGKVSKKSVQTSLNDYINYSSKDDASDTLISYKKDVLAAYVYNLNDADAAIQIFGNKNKALYDEIIQMINNATIAQESFNQAQNEFSIAKNNIFNLSDKKSWTLGQASEFRKILKTDGIESALKYTVELLGFKIPQAASNAKEALSGVNDKLNNNNTDNLSILPIEVSPEINEDEWLASINSALSSLAPKLDKLKIDADTDALIDEIKNAINTYFDQNPLFAYGDSKPKNTDTQDDEVVSPIKEATDEWELAFKAAKQYNTELSNIVRITKKVKTTKDGKQSVSYNVTDINGKSVTINKGSRTFSGKIKDDIDKVNESYEKTKELLAEQYELENKIDDAKTEAKLNNSVNNKDDIEKWNERIEAIKTAIAVEEEYRKKNNFVDSNKDKNVQEYKDTLSKNNEDKKAERDRKFNNRLNALHGQALDDNAAFDKNKRDNAINESYSKTNALLKEQYELENKIAIAENDVRNNSTDSNSDIQQWKTRVAEIRNAIKAEEEYREKNNLIDSEKNKKAQEYESNLSDKNKKAIDRQMDSLYSQALQDNKRFDQEAKQRAKESNASYTKSYKLLEKQYELENKITDAKIKGATSQDENIQKWNEELEKTKEAIRLQEEYRKNNGYGSDTKDEQLEKHKEDLIIDNIISRKKSEANVILTEQKDDFTAIYNIRKKIASLDPVKDKEQIDLLNREKQSQQDIYDQKQKELSLYDNIIDKEKQLKDLKEIKDSGEKEIELISARKRDRDTSKTKAPKDLLESDKNLARVVDLYDTYLSTLQQIRALQDKENESGLSDDEETRLNKLLSERMTLETQINEELNKEHNTTKSIQKVIENIKTLRDDVENNGLDNIDLDRESQSRRITNIDSAFDEAQNINNLVNQASQSINQLKISKGMSDNSKAYTDARASLEKYNNSLIAGTIDIQSYEKKVNSLKNSLGQIVQVLDGDISDADAMTQIKKYFDQISKGKFSIIREGIGKNGIPQMTAQFVDHLGKVNKVTVAYDRAKQALVQLSTTGTKQVSGLSKFMDQLGNKALDLVKYLLSFRLFDNAWQTFRQGWGYVRDFDAAMTELIKVSNDSVNELKEFGRESFNVAQQVGSTGRDITQAAADWSRLGYNIKEASELAKASAIYVNVGDMDINTATEHMVSTLQGFQLQADKSIDIVDKFNKVGL